jgi:hypothetical protein
MRKKTKNESNENRQIGGVVLRKFSERDIVKILKNNVYKLVRSGKGIHTIWSNGINVITLPALYKLHSVVVLRLIKENNLLV